MSHHAPEPPAVGIERAAHLQEYERDLISRYLNSYHGEELRFAESIHFHKTEKSVGRKQLKDHLLIIGKYRFAVFKGKLITKRKKIQRSLHLFEIRTIELQNSVMKMTLDDGNSFYVTLQKDSQMELFGLIIYAIRLGQSLITSSDSFNTHGHIKITVPDNSYLLPLPPITRGGAGGLMNAYISSSNYTKNAFIFEDFVEHIKRVEQTGEDWLDLRFLPGPDPRSDAYLGIHTILFSLTHNNHFKTLIIKDIALQTGSLFGLHKIQYGNLLGKAQISKLFRYNTTLTKVIVFHPSSGGADLDWEGMDSAIRSNPENKIQYLDISENKLNLRQIYSISKTISHLGHGLKVLKLANCNLNDRGLNFVIKALEYHSVCITLEELDLSQNLFAEASSAHFATYLKNTAEYSRLRILGLRNTQILFKMVLPWFRVVKSLEWLDISMNRLDRVDPPDVGYLLHLPNLTHLDLSSNYIFEDAIYGLLSAKPPNQNRRMHLNLKGNIVSGFEVVSKALEDIVYQLESLDLSGMRLRAKGIVRILPLLTRKCSNLVSLNIGTNLVSSSEASLACQAVVDYLKINPQLKRLGVGSNHLNPTHKEGFHHLFDYLRENNTLEELDISENYIGDKVFMGLVQALKTNKGLKVIRCDKNNLTSNSFLSLKYCIERHNSTLLELPFPRSDYRQSYKPLNKIRRLRFVHIMQEIEYLLRRNRGGEKSRYDEEKNIGDLHEPIHGLIPLTLDLPERLRHSDSERSVAVSFPEPDLEPLPPVEPESIPPSYNKGKPRSYSIGSEASDSSSDSLDHEAVLPPK